jgi:hypothetical protein
MFKFKLYLITLLLIQINYFIKCQNDETRDGGSGGGNIYR